MIVNNYYDRTIDNDHDRKKIESYLSALSRFSRATDNDQLVVDNGIHELTLGSPNWESFPLSQEFVISRGKRQPVKLIQLQEIITVQVLICINICRFLHP